MDAIIADGQTLDLGAVAGVRNIANPVSLARAVMEKTEHVMLVGDGANRFAREIGVPELDPRDLISEAARKDWERCSRYEACVRTVFNHPDKPGAMETDSKTTALSAAKENSSATTGHDTVGAVAIDTRGNVAAATSTGGITYKRTGRVGDSPLIGSGAYCDNEVGGVSCTGHGEGIARVLLARRALTLLEHGRAGSPQEALEQALCYMWERVGSRGGAIMVGADGTTAKSFTTRRMAWASVDHTGKVECSLDSPRLLLSE